MYIYLFCDLFILHLLHKINDKIYHYLNYNT